MLLLFLWIHSWVFFPPLGKLYCTVSPSTIACLSPNPGHCLGWAGEEAGCAVERSQTFDLEDLVELLASLLTSYMSLGGLPNIFAPQFPHLQNGNTDAFLTGSL